MSIHSKLVSGRRAMAVAGGAFATALVLAACGGSNDTPEGAVENFLDNGIEDFAEAFAAGDFDRVAEIGEDHFCAEDVESLRQTADELDAMSDEERAQMEELLGSQEDMLPEDWSYEIGETNEDGDTATVEVEVEMTEGDEEPKSNSIDVVKEDDEWKLCGEFGV